VTEVSYRPMQKAGIGAAYAALRSGERGYLLWWDPGMGKTLATLTEAKLLQAQRVLVVTNVAGLGVWAREIQKWTPGAGYSVIRGKDQPYQLYARTDESYPTYVITNYDQVRSRDKGRTFSILNKMRFDLMVLDESQYIAAPDSQQQRSVTQLAKRADKILLLSGTPANNAFGWWTQFRLIDPNNPLWKQSHGSYKKQVAYVGGPAGNWVEGYRQDVIDTIVMPQMARLTHRASIEELQLPEPIETPITVRLSPKERRVYQEMEQNFFADLGDGAVADANIVLTKAMRLHQITGGFVTNTNGESAEVGRTKLDVCLDLIRDRPDQKIIVACRFTAELRALGIALTKMGRPWQIIDGTVSAGNRAQIENNFQHPSSYVKSVLLLQYKAGGTALTLTAAKTLVLYSLNPSTIDLRQMIGRVYRIGQTTNVQVLPLLAENTVDVRLWEGLKLNLERVELARYLARRSA
jgi:SNF2 family DNA or RNA helicase